MSQHSIKPEHVLLLQQIFGDALEDVKVRPGDWQFVGDETSFHVNFSSHSSLPSSISSVNDCMGGSFYVVHTDDEVDPVTLKARERRDECISIVTALTDAFLSDYYPWLLWQKDPRKIKLSALELHAVNKLKSSLPQSIPSLIFSAPRGIGNLEKNLTLATMRAVSSFIHDYTKVFLDLKKRDASFDRKDDAQQQQLLVKHLRILLQMKGKAYLPPKMDKDAIALNLTSKIEELIGTILSISNASPLMNIFAFIVPSLKIPLLIEQILTPHLFCMLIEQFFLNDTLQNHQQSGVDPSIPLSIFPADDDLFTLESGRIVSIITQDVFDLGEASGIINTIPALMGRFEEKIGTLIQQSLSLAFNQECSLPLFIALKLFLYDKEGNPYLIDALTNPAISSHANHTAIREQVKGRIQEIIKPHLPSGVGFLMNHFTDFDGFCSRLSERLFMLTQREWILKLMICYILDGMIDGLKQKVNSNVSAK